MGKEGKAINATSIQEWDYFEQIWELFVTVVPQTHVNSFSFLHSTQQCKFKSLMCLSAETMNSWHMIERHFWTLATSVLSHQLYRSFSEREMD